ncbi:copper chaperone PCu(A)C [Nocardia higoensis]|uniref:copper chaperone PCu(A)C n=1 Tax=Nocardia higoensis TaxID=228599 RepID=UPI0005946078|nr:copper chaperone PCu(A)C [Nocardia higoensis]
MHRRIAGLAAVAIAPLLLSACSGDNSPAEATAAETVTIQDQWIKAADSGMSAAFGSLTNSGGREATIVSASSPASERVELHEVVVDAGGAKTMREKDGGFVLPAGGTLTLAPGGEHLMFMDLHGPLRTGSEVPVTLSFADGSTTTFTAQVRDFAGNQENYTPGSGHDAPATPHDGA